MSKGKLLAVCIVWLVIIAMLAVTWRFVVHPLRRKQAMDGTITPSRYEDSIDFALDSFSGYAILRSPEFREELAKKRIRVNLLDDGADYAARFDKICRGDVQMAVFTIDALVKLSAQIDELPCTIVSIIDETRGADAIVAYKSVVPNVDALNREEMLFVLTPDSPSETLARVVMTRFNLQNLPAQPFRTAADAQAVYKLYLKARPDDKQVFVLWEPFVSKMLENPNLRVVVDSSMFSGYIVDVIVANRDFLLKNEPLVAQVVGAYFRTAYRYRNKMVELVLSDAKQTGTPLSQKQAENLVNGIWWKNTQENFAHFGLQATQPVQLMEDMITNIVGVLKTTGAIDFDPTDGKPGMIFYDKTLRRLQSSNFHPGLADETVRDDKLQLPALSDREWERLVPIGTLSVPELVFARGTDRLTSASQVILDDLIKSLDSLPQSYLLIRGNASREGNLEANADLAERRAKAAEQYLITAGVDRNRVRAVGVEPSGRTSVSFVLGQPPY